MTLGVRPEHVSVAGAASGYAFDGRVAVVEPMGADTLLWTELGGQPMSVRVDGERVFEVGQTLRFTFDPARLSVFDAATGERV